MEQITLKASDSMDICALQSGMDDDKAKAAVIICHGFGEHSGLYTELAEVLHKAGYAAIIHNQRGHGLPPEGLKNFHGRIPGYRSFIDDVITVTGYINEKRPGLPVALYGHSMGGNIVINTLLRSLEGHGRPGSGKTSAPGYLCAILEAPWLGLHNDPGLIQTAAIRVLNAIYPNFRIAHKMRYDELSTVPERADGYAKDPLYHGFLSARMITGIFDACSYALANAGSFPLDAFLAYADDDTVVCNSAIKEFANSAGEAITLKEYSSKHAIHNDAQREAFFADMIAYLDKYADK